MGRVERGARVLALIMEGSRCTGVEAETAAGKKTFSARAVVIADGGFQANLDWLRQGIAPKAEAVKQRGAATDADTEQAEPGEDAAEVMRRQAVIEAEEAKHQHDTRDGQAKRRKARQQDDDDQAEQQRQQEDEVDRKSVV